MLKSVKNLSDELGVEKFRIYKFIKDNDLKVTHLGSSKIMYFDEREAEKIIRAFTPELAYEDEHGEPMPGRSTTIPAEEPESEPLLEKGTEEDEPEIPESVEEKGQPYEDLILDLRRELEEKTRQIDSMNTQLTNMTGALRNANDCIKRLSEGTRNLTESLRASQAMYLNAVRSIGEEQEKTRLLQGQVAEAEADREAARKEAAENAAAVREATEMAQSAKEAAEKAVALARSKAAAAAADNAAGHKPVSQRRRTFLDRLLGR